MARPRTGIPPIVSLKPVVVRHSIVVEVEVEGLVAQLDQARKKSGKTVRSVMKAAGLSENYWGNLIRGTTKTIELKTLLNIQEILGVSLLEDLSKWEPKKVSATEGGSHAS
jgi:transcriptional regulator with XRE-family HTH domain